MKLNKKSYIIGAVLLVLLTTVFFVFGRKQAPKEIINETSEIEELIPTIDSSVKVSLDSVAGSKELLLKVDNLPSNTQSVDYELSYQTAQQGLQGVIGTITNEKDSFEKKLTLGTCSSGTCVYHQVVGKIKLTLKFTGGYGEKIFGKEYEI